MNAPKKLFKWFSATGAVISTLFLLGLVADLLLPEISQYRDRKARFDTVSYEIIREVTSRLDKMEEQLSGSEEALKAAQLGNKIIMLEDRIKQVDNNTLALRQAINPLKPNEVLTIVRLVDEVKILKSQITTNRKSLEKEMQSFKTSVIREGKSLNNTTNLILLVLIPLVLNFLYTVYKDFRSERRGSKDPVKPPDE